MAQTMINFRIDEELKKRMEQACKEMGLSITTAFTIFAIKVGKEKRVPFEVAVDPDPFYSEANMNRLRAAIADVTSGKSKLTEHELIEVESGNAVLIIGIAKKWNRWIAFMREVSEQGVR